MIKSIFLALVTLLFVSGCTLPVTLDNLKPANAMPPTEMASGNYAVSILGAAGRTVVLDVGEPSSVLGEKVVVTAPYGDPLARTLESDIQAYAGGGRIIPRDTPTPVLLSTDDGLIVVRMSEISARAAIEMQRVYMPAYGGPGARGATVTVRHSGEVILTDKSGKSLRRQIAASASGTGGNFFWGVKTLVPAAFREAMEKSLSEVSRQAVDGIVQMRRELATKPNS